MSRKLKIVSDGTASGTHVHSGGIELDGITEIEFEPIKPGGIVSVKITFHMVELDVAAELYPISDDGRFLQQTITVKPIDSKLAK